MAKTKASPTVVPQPGASGFPRPVLWHLGPGSVKRLTAGPGSKQFYPLDGALEAIISNTLHDHPAAQQSGQLVVLCDTPPGQTHLPGEAMGEVARVFGQALVEAVTSGTPQVAELSHTAHGRYRFELHFCREALDASRPIGGPAPPAPLQGKKLAPNRGVGQNVPQMPAKGGRATDDNQGQDPLTSGMDALRPPATGPDAVRRAVETLARITEMCARLDTESDFLTAKASLLEVVHEFQVGVLAPLAEGPINKTLRTFPTDTIEQKRVLAKWLNTALGSIWLAAADPRTGDPTNIVAGTGGNPAKGRFEFVGAPAPDGARQKTTMTVLPDHVRLTSAKPETKPGHASAVKSEQQIQRSKMRRKK